MGGHPVKAPLRRGPQAPQAQELVWVGGKVPGAGRMKRAKRAVVLTEAMIPEGSVISDETLAHIRAGDYAVRMPAQLSPRYSQRPKLRKRARMASDSRRRNRRTK